MKVYTWSVGNSIIVLYIGLILIDGYTQGRWYWEWTGFSGATFWDWLDLLIVPLILGIGGISLQRTQRKRELENQERQREREQEEDERRRQREVDLEKRQRERELETEEQRAQAAALQAYLEQMGRIILNDDLRDTPREAARGPSTLARAYTLTTLERIDARRKRTVVRFLFEAKLITMTEGRAGLVSLSEADLSRAALSGMYLAGIDLGGAKLSGADLSNTRLTTLVSIGSPTTPTDNPGVAAGRVSPGIVMMTPSNAHDITHFRPTVRSRLEEADLSWANMRDAELTYCDFRAAQLTGADLRGADLRDARFLMPNQIQDAIGDHRTRLPKNMQRPEEWSWSYQEQLNRIHELEHEKDVLEEWHNEDLIR